MGIRLLKIAAIYLVLGSFMGLYMGIVETFTLHPVHAHLNLLGWASLGLAGLMVVGLTVALMPKCSQPAVW